MPSKYLTAELAYSKTESEEKKGMKLTPVGNLEANPWHLSGTCQARPRHAPSIFPPRGDIHPCAAGSDGRCASRGTRTIAKPSGPVCPALTFEVGSGPSGANISPIGTPPSLRAVLDG